MGKKQEHKPPASTETPAEAVTVCQVDTDGIDPDAVDVKNVDWGDLPPVRRSAASPPAGGGRANSGGQAAAVSPAGPVQPSDPPAGAGGGSAKTKGEPANQEVPESEHIAIPNELGILPLRNAVVFPGTVMPLAVGRPRSRRLLAEVLVGSPARPGEKLIGVLTQKDPATDTPGFGQLYQIGAVCAILKLLKQPDGQNSLVVHGLVRFRVVEWLSATPYLKARIEVLTPSTARTRNLEALLTSVRHAAQRMVALSPNIPDEVNVVLSNIEDPSALADFLAANVPMPAAKRQELLETLDVAERLNKLSVVVAEQIELLEMSAKIQQRVSKSIDKTQREYFLQEQLKAIQSELGQTDQRSADVEELRQRLEAAQLPAAVHEEAWRELDRLNQIPTMSPEYAVLHNYLEWLSELPWARGTRDHLDLNRARRILNADHHGLTKVKRRILEFLAVRKLNPSGRSPILCFAGPPGVGKTSLGRSIARAMGRKFVRVSLGGIRDEADIRGHRRTYIGALPGRVIQELRKCGSRNPVFMLDELDKIGQDFRGDPSAALLEVLDPEQNNSFTDHFIDQPFDLSKVMFIGTANYMGGVTPPLRDRMEVLELPGYTAHEKLAIAKRYLLPRQRQENGLSVAQLVIRDDTLRALIESYTREAGVRELERQIAAICRAAAAEEASGQRRGAVVPARRLLQMLGPAPYESELALRTGTPGVATGLAYTPVGGEILFIESTLTAGTGRLILTGQLGEVMKESAQAALSVLKSQALALQRRRGNGPLAGLVGTLTDTKTLAKQDIHIHVPAGAVPKDGPSAGLAIYTSLASLLLDRPVRAEVAMTGEVTLRGLVMPIGGVKEKLLAAKRAGIKTVILPERNRKDLYDLPKDVLRGLKCRFVGRVDKVLQAALEETAHRSRKR